MNMILLPYRFVVTLIRYAIFGKVTTLAPDKALRYDSEVF